MLKQPFKNINKRSEIKTIVFYYLLVFSFFCRNALDAQINLTANNNAQQLIQNIVGQGFYIFNASLHCPNGASGTFINNGSNINVTDGIILTTGGINICSGPNNSISAGVNNGGPGDAHLDVVSGATTYDACALEFDLIPACDTLKINYVFASEEYPEYVNKPFNDVFGFFISGKGFAPNTNIAWLPGTNTPVSINTVNAGANSQYFVNNTNGQTIQYDGFTKPLVAKAKVSTCDTFHLKIVIADVNDGIYDSGVLIKGNSINCSPVVYTDMAASVNGLENCQSINITFCRSGDSTLAYPITYVVGGTATNGVDYQQLTGSATIPANKACVQIPIIPIPDNVIEGQEVITIAYQFGFCPKWDTLKVYLNDPPPFDAGPDITLCLKDSAKMGIPPVAGMVYTWQPTIALSNSLVSNPKIGAGNALGNCAAQYVLTGTSLATGCVFKDSLKVKVNPLPTAIFNVGTDYCVDQIVNVLDLSVAAGGGTISYWHWDFGNGLLNSVQAPSVAYPTAGRDTIKLVASDNFGCKDDTFKIVNVWPKPDAKFTVKSSCAGDSVFFKNQSTVPSGGILAQSIWTFGDSSPLLINSSPNVAHLYPTASNVFNVQLLITSDKGCVSSFSNVVYLNPKPVASFKDSSVCYYRKMKFVNLSVSDNSFWKFGDGNTSTSSNPTHLYSNPGTYNVTLIASTNYGCKDSTTHSVTLYDKPKFTYTAKDTAGCPYFCTSFKAIKNPASTIPIVNWLWDLGTGDKMTGADIDYCYKNSGKFSPQLIAVSDKGCVDTVIKSLFIDVYPVPNANFNVTNAGDLSAYDPLASIVNNSSSDAIKWQWNFGDGSNSGLQYPPAHNYPIPASYTITLMVENVYGCRDTTWRGILVQSTETIYIPNTFTPNDDDKNENFHPYCSGLYEEADFVMYIFNRFGQNICTSYEVNKGWDGTFKGRPCQQGVYVYQCFFYSKADKSLIAKFKGTVNLIY